VPSPDTLDWVEAEFKHRSALGRFVCADPPRSSWDKHRGKFHPKPWELELQSGLRNLRPPFPGGDLLLLGLDEHGEIIAIVRIGWDIDVSHLLVLAVAVHADHQRNGHGRSALELALAVLTGTNEAYEGQCGFFAHIHQGNAPSQKLFASLGFENLGVMDSGSHETWVFA
jgi:RimJ/RimL family protein N-acetyltransferase